MGCDKMALIENAFAGIVVTAQSFNPTIFTETWLSENGVLSPDSLEGVRVFSPEVAQFQTPEVRVQIIAPKMQISFRIHNVSGNFEVPLKIPARTFELLPHTPYQALGLNFDYYVLPPEDQDFFSYNRSLLGTGDYRLLEEFSTSNARFGRYFSKDYGDARLRLDIKPVKGGPDNRDLIQFSFNFHFDVADLDIAARSCKLIEHINTWATLREYSLRLVELGSTPLTIPETT